MKGLWKYMSPFAPDQSGASAVLYDLGGIIVICDAGGCAGNVCGFDEPRWFTQRSAIFSAGLRDMDAVFGRDEQLVDKLVSAADNLHGEAEFAAIIGTPVPAVIGTDYMALKRLAHKKSHLAVITVDTDGMELYDAGAAKAYMAVFKKFALEKDKAADLAAEYGILPDDIELIIGSTPLDVPKEGYEAGNGSSGLKSGRGGLKPGGFGTGLVYIKLSALSRKNIVTAPSGLPAARYLKERFGTPYECRYPYIDSGDSVLKDKIASRFFKGRKVLVIHQLVAANEVKKLIEEGTDGDCDVTSATWFSRSKELVPDECESPVLLKEEDDLEELIREEGFDVIIADPVMKKALREFDGEFIDFMHFAVSGHSD